MTDAEAQAAASWAARHRAAVERRAEVAQRLDDARRHWERRRLEIDRGFAPGEQRWLADLGSAFEAAAAGAGIALRNGDLSSLLRRVLVLAATVTAMEERLEQQKRWLGIVACRRQLVEAVSVDLFGELRVLSGFRRLQSGLAAKIEAGLWDSIAPALRWLCHEIDSWRTLRRPEETHRRDQLFERVPIARETWQRLRGLALPGLAEQVALELAGDASWQIRQLAPAPDIEPLEQTRRRAEDCGARLEQWLRIQGKGGRLGQSDAR